MDKEISYEDFLNMTDKQHINKIKSMPVKHLIKFGESFFISKDGCAIALKDELKDVIGSDVFAEHFKDAIDYRVMEYYRSRYLMEK